MTTQSPTYLNQFPANQEEVLRAHKRDIQKAINCARVGIIKDYDPGQAGVRAPTASVLIAQQQVTSIAEDGTETLAPYPPLKECPVFFPSGGDFCLTFPVLVGDECLVLFHDRELDNWLINGTGTNNQGLPPTTGRTHDISDAIVFVGMRSNPNAISAPSTTSVQLRSNDNSTYVEVAGGQVVNIIAPGGINLNGVHIDAVGNMTVPETLNVQNTGGAATPSTVNGGFKVTGGDIVADSISLKNHVHTGVTTGGGNTGGAVG